jgi:hypothetical protein
VSPANQIRDYVDRHYLNGSPAGRELLDIADRVDALTDAASPVSGKNDDPVPKESHAK